MISCAELTDEQNDSHRLHPMIDATTASLAETGIAERPEKLLAYAGYASEGNFAALDRADPAAYVTTRNMKNSPARPTGRRGPLRNDATLLEPKAAKYRGSPATPPYCRRQQLIEPVFGQNKDVRGIRGFMRRGRAACDSEWKLICGTH